MRLVEASDPRDLSWKDVKGNWKNYDGSGEKEVEAEVQVKMWWARTSERQGRMRHGLGSGLLHRDISSVRRGQNLALSVGGWGAWGWKSLEMSCQGVMVTGLIWVTRGDSSGISCGFYEPRDEVISWYGEVTKGSVTEDLERPGNETFLMRSEGLSHGSVIRE